MYVLNGRPHGKLKSDHENSELPTKCGFNGQNSCGITVSEKCFTVVLGDYFSLVGKDFIK